MCCHGNVTIIPFISRIHKILFYIYKYDILFMTDHRNNPLVWLLIHQSPDHCCPWHDFWSTKHLFLRIAAPGTSPDDRCDTWHDYWSTNLTGRTASGYRDWLPGTKFLQVSESARLDPLNYFFWQTAVVTTIRLYNNPSKLSLKIIKLSSKGKIFYMRHICKLRKC